MAMECEGSGDIVVELLPADGAVTFKVSIAVVNQMRILKNMLEGDAVDFRSFAASVAYEFIVL